jgi:hypothetical protein
MPITTGITTIEIKSSLNMPVAPGRPSRYRDPRTRVSRGRGREAAGRPRRPHARPRGATRTWRRSPSSRPLRARSAATDRPICDNISPITLCRAGRHRTRRHRP